MGEGAAPGRISPLPPSDARLQRHPRCPIVDDRSSGNEHVGTHHAVHRHHAGGLELLVHMGQVYETDPEITQAHRCQRQRHRLPQLARVGVSFVEQAVAMEAAEDTTLHDVLQLVSVLRSEPVDFMEAGLAVGRM